MKARVLRKGHGGFGHKLTEQERSSSNRIPSPDLGRDFNYEGSVSAAVHLARARKYSSLIYSSLARLSRRKQINLQPGDISPLLRCVKATESSFLPANAGYRIIRHQNNSTLWWTSMIGWILARDRSINRVKKSSEGDPHVNGK